MTDLPPDEPPAAPGLTEDIEGGGDQIRARAAEPVAAPVSGRPDYDEMIKVRTLKAGEPYFVVRGQDRLSGEVVRTYAELLFRAEASPALVESALQLADAMDAFGPKKLPDADHLSEAEQTQLAWQLENRAWKAREEGEIPPGELLLATQRGWTDGFNLGSRRKDERAQALERAAWIAVEALTVMPPEDPARAAKAIGALRDVLGTAIPRDREPNSVTVGEGVVTYSPAPLVTHPALPVTGKDV